MSVEATVKLSINVEETLVTGVDDVEQPTLTHSGFSTTKKLNSTTTPPATKTYSDTVALVAGAKTLDLTSLVGTGGATITMLGLKLQALKIKNAAGNGALTITGGASDGYNLFGAAGSMVLGAEEEVCCLYNDTKDDVAAGDKNIDFAGTGTQEFDVQLVFG